MARSSKPQPRVDVRLAPGERVLIEVGPTTVEVEVCGAARYADGKVRSRVRVHSPRRFGRVELRPAIGLADVQTELPTVAKETQGR